MTFLLVLLIVAIFVLLLIPTIIFSIIRTILSILGFSLHRRSGRNASSRGYSQQSRTTTGDSSYKHSNRDDGNASRKKMFDKNEGEYVDFEEIKDEK